jgi:hypothetical protein
MDAETMDTAGEPRVRGPRILKPAKCSFWVSQLEPTSQSCDLEEFLDEIATRLADKAAVLKRHAERGGEADLYIGYFLEKANTGFSLSPALLRRFADMHVELIFDIYGNDAEETSPQTESTTQ